MSGTDPGPSTRPRASNASNPDLKSRRAFGGVDGLFLVVLYCTFKRTCIPESIETEHRYETRVLARPDPSKLMLLTLHIF